MRIAITGGTGLVGRFIVEDAIRRGQMVTVMGRTPPSPGFFSQPVRFLPYDLGAPPPPLDGHDALVHAAFDHVPGRYRGGEGTDPAGFLRRNVDGSIALFAAATRAGLNRTVFLSSRAVYGDYPAGTTLVESLEPRPDTLYGQAKLAAELALVGLGAGRAVSLRATGVYGPPGPGQTHKWATLFADFRAGHQIAPRCATEVHGADLAKAVQIVLSTDTESILNVSDFALDLHDLLTQVALIEGLAIAPPARATQMVSEMQTDRLRAHGWEPSGLAGLGTALGTMLVQR